MTREQALALEYSRYFTGVPCKYGHVSERYTCNYNCIACHKIKKKLSSPYIPTGFPRGRPKVGEERPRSKGAIAQAKYRAERLARDPSYRETLNAYFRKAYYKKRVQEGKTEL